MAFRDFTCPKVLRDFVVPIDLVEYHIREIDRILGGLVFMFESNLVPTHP